MRLARRILSGALLAAAVAGCDSNDAGPGIARPDGAGGTLVVALAAAPDNLFPLFVRTAAGRQVSDQIFERLADLGSGGNTAGSDDFTPRLARAWEWSADSLRITFSIDPAARWHDGTPVSAGDVAFTVSLYKDATVSEAAEKLAIIDSVTAPDSLTAVFWFGARHAEQFYIATQDMRILPWHLLGDIPRGELAASPVMRSPTGSGPFRFVNWTQGPTAVIELAGDTANYRGRPALDVLRFAIAEDFNAAATQVMTGDGDFSEIVQPAMEELLRNPQVKTAVYPANEYAYLAFNFRERLGGARPHPILGDHGVRAAIAMAINRESLVRNVFDSLGAVALGPFVRSMSVADTTVRQIPYDPTRAARILDTLGWRMPSIGEIRMKGGRLLEFSVLLPNSSQTRERAALLLQEDLRRIGVSLIIDDPDHATFASRRAAHDFDSYFGTRLVTPSPSDLRIQWGAGTIVGNASQNHGWYENRAMTAIIDSAIATTNPERRRAFFKRACQLITDDVAAVWLYEPRNIAAVKTNATVTGLNAWSWWDDIRNWRVGTAAAAARQ